MLKRLKNLLFFFIISAFCSMSAENDLVLSTKMILLDDYPTAFNPSIIKLNENYLLTFRNIPKNPEAWWFCEIGVVLLNDSFDPISEPQILSIRSQDNHVPSQAEDARVFSFNDRLFLIYNDNDEVVAPWTWHRRDMFLAELFYEEGQFTLGTPLKLYNPAKSDQLWQKNWTPFEWKGHLLLSYSFQPHEILFPDLGTGQCYFNYKTSCSLNWNYGTIRGGTPPQLLDGEFLSFFHSGIVMSSPSSWNRAAWHYFMGAYTFSSEPPFEIRKISPKPIVAKGFYTLSNAPKKVIFPGGFVIDDSHIHVAYGKDDREIWIATLDKKVLMSQLIPVQSDPKSLNKE